MKKTTSFVVRLSVIQRFGCVLAAVLVAIAVEPPGWSNGLKFLVPWDVGAATYLVLAWTLIVRSDASETRLHARAQDVAAYVIFIVVLVAAFASIVAIAVLVGEAKELTGWHKAVYLALSVAALLSSWFLIHTLFSFQYRDPRAGNQQYRRRDLAENCGMVPAAHTEVLFSAVK